MCSPSSPRAYIVLAAASSAHSRLTYVQRLVAYSGDAIIARQTSFQCPLADSNPFASHGTAAIPEGTWVITVNGYCEHLEMLNRGASESINSMERIRPSSCCFSAPRPYPRGPGTFLSGPRSNMFLLSFNPLSRRTVVFCVARLAVEGRHWSTTRSQLKPEPQYSNANATTPV